ncbi:hypothetical protein AJ79_01407 [Helicocarpus griseus UAMH5409]|uniref:Uncharacterized protein n=1 Tax=Helicocarpus griseus UAMH5409 TaxID=1447875 RepID=A0A2B7Y7L4_9EURO|nr:hypothetical protein AJ79_01407 [Helicocarpus griseus UAMH5409]
MPQHWPLRRLLISSACGEAFQTPFVLEGKVNHLILLLTSGLRFEGPTSDELREANKQAIARGEAKEDFIIAHEGTPEERKITITSIPSLASEWLVRKYATGEEGTVLGNADVDLDKINLEKLKILENDAMDTFTRMTLALTHIVAGKLKTINIRSTNGCDFRFTPEDLFPQLLAQLPSLNTLVLTVGEVFHDSNHVYNLYKSLPPNIPTLRFRGPISLAKSEQCKDWIASFSNPEYLPNLKRLSFVLDLYYDVKDTKLIEPKPKKSKAPEEQLREAKAACNQLLDVASKRGISVEPFVEQWTEKCEQLEQVDERWEEL